MPEIHGFRGWRYHLEKTRGAGVFAPPYDVISKKQQDALYKKNPFNVIRLELGHDEKGDTARRNKYTRARDFLDDWKTRGVLTQEAEPSLYVYAQDYKEDGKAVTRLGFFAAMAIDERSVLKHENTLAAPKKDRMALLKSVRTNLSPIFGLIEDKAAATNRILRDAIRNRPVIDVTVDGVRHRLFVESRPEVLRQTAAVLRDKPMFIADGHHRFEVACQFRRWMRSNGAGSGPWDSVMTYFSDCLHNPFKIFPTHRLLRPVGDPFKALEKRGALKKVHGLGDVLKALEKTRRQTRDGRYTFGLFDKKKGFWLFTLDSRLAPKPSAGAVKVLDVSVLHEKIIAPLFGIRAVEKSEAIDFTRDAREAVEKVVSGEFGLAVFLRPTSLAEMILASKKGLKMPQKSTYFYPKLLSGLVFHGLDPEGVLC